VRRRLPGGYELDDDPERVDLDEVCRFLSNDSYWARGRPRPKIEGSIRASARVVGLYDSGGRQIGFARAVSDGVVTAYLADVYVLAEHRGRGLGLELVRELVERGSLAGCDWLLHTADAHGLYGKLGFGKPSPRLMERGRRETSGWEG
jgi:GNAT superfamily N-acetyltransferase